MSENSKTDWDRIDRMDDGDIDLADAPELGEEFFAQAELRMPEGSSWVRLPIEADILAWLKKGESDWGHRVNAVLRRHISDQSPERNPV